jgi:hypothetical protein
MGLMGKEYHQDGIQGKSTLLLSIPEDIFFPQCLVFARTRNRSWVRESVLRSQTCVPSQEQKGK